MLHPDPASVPVTFIGDRSQLGALATALDRATHVAIDTETPMVERGIGPLRVMSVAVRMPDRSELAFVVDARDVDASALAPLLDGVTAAAWNANFDARVLDRAIWCSHDVTRGLKWWDAQLADALLYQGRSGFTWYHGLAWATQRYLNLEAQGKGTVQLSYTIDADLTTEQIAYAAADAVETLWVADVLRDELRKAGLEKIAAIEMAARPFLDQMERSGLPFDWDGWAGELSSMEGAHRRTLGRLADLTGGGQGTLFDEVVEPNWNPASDKQVRVALNRWAAERVAAWTTTRFGAARELTERDSVTASVLREIGGPLCEALLEFRNHAKVLSTYGESIRDHLHDDGRMRPQYLQVVGTNTGRLASRNPNAQNFTPLMKPYVRPPTTDRVFVYADLSQAELRFLAQVANDAPLREAFARGVDVHVATAASMFGFDPDELRRTSPERFKELRQTAKALNFGIAYGTGAAALARSLTANGTPTTTDEGRTLLSQYRATYPGTAAWAEERIAEIGAIRQRTHRIDWPLTMRLARSFAPIASVRREFRQTQGRWPTAVEVAEAMPSGVLADGDHQVDHIAWVLRQSASVALVGDGQAFTFSRRTVAGRRQQFNLHLDRLFLFAAIDAVRSGSQRLVGVRSTFEREHGVELYRPGGLRDDELARQFEDRTLRRRYVESVIDHAGPEVGYALLDRAAKERVQAMVNAWRNAPIQGGVADIMLDAYARLHEALAAHPSAWPVQTVHDSVVVECDQSEAAVIADVVRTALEQASSRFCPDVTPKADVDVRTSLADGDVIAVLQ